jgi:FAD/FMN-containing dehydrogenase
MPPSATSDVLLHSNDIPGKLKVPSRPTSAAEGDPLVLPPGVTSATFQTFLTRARSITGADNVRLITSAAQLVDGSYRAPNMTHDMHAILPREYFVCSATIAPRAVPEVQALLRLCNELEVPVWPVSIGRNTGYGGAAPRVPGSVCLELGKHMNRVLEVNTEGAYALVEPGVTYADLHEYLEERGLREKVWMDVSSALGGCCEI